MRQGKSIQELATEIARQAEAKRDFLLPTSAMRLELDGKEEKLAFDRDGAKEAFAVSRPCHEQLATHLEVPQAFYDRLKEQHADLHAGLVTKLLERGSAPRLLRTLDGSARACLSNAYRRIDNIDVLESILPVVAGLPSAAVASCEVTESRLHLKVVVDEVRGWAEYKKPGTHERIRQEVRSGFYVSNSEIGRGAYSVRPFCEVLACTNGMIIEELSHRVRHTGRRMAVEGIAEELMSTRTRELTDAATLSQTRDLVGVALDPKRFAAICDKMSQAGEDPIEGDVVKVLELVSKDHGLRQDETKSVLEHLIRGGDLSRWGALNAVTRTAQDSPSYDRATELEAVGGKLLALSSEEWSRYRVN